MSQALQNHDAERSLIGCFLNSEKAIDDAGDIRLDDFTHPNYQRIFEVIRRLRDERRPVDLVTVGDEMQRLGTLRALGDDSLAAIAIHIPTWHNVKHYGSLVARYGTARRLVLVCSDVAGKANSVEDVEGLVAETRQKIADLDTRRDGGPVRLGDRLGEVLERTGQKAADQDAQRVRTGIGKFDRIIGGFRSPQLVVVAARPGMGKTAFSGSVALRAAMRGIPTLVFSLEMSFDEMAERFIGANARFSVERISRGDLQYAEYRRLYDGIGHLSTAPLWIDDRLLTAGQIAATARQWRLRQKETRGLVVIDYLGLIKSTERRSETRALEVGGMARAAKSIAKDIECPVMLVAQLNRANEKENREPMMSDLRDSGEIEAHADMIIFPHREPPLESSGPAALIVPKNRGGKTGKIDCWWHAEFMTFEGAEAEEPEGRYSR